jgi:uncharacterized protein with FMN-binding domain
MARLDPKKIALSGLVVISFALYSFYMRNPDDGPVTVTPKAKPSNNSSVTQTTTRYKDGKYIGTVTDAFYGNIQVQVTISAGKIAAIDFLQYPNDRPESTSINMQAMPLLRQEAIKAQGSQVDGVSGATDTSQAFQESLSAALAKAM